MTRAQLIEKALADIRMPCFRPDTQIKDDDEAFVAYVLLELLPDADIQTCDDFRYLGISAAQHAMPCPTMR